MLTQSQGTLQTRMFITRKDLLYTDGLDLEFLCPHSLADFPCTNPILLFTYAPAEHLVMSSTEEDQRDDAVTRTETGRSFVQSLINVLSGSATRAVTTPAARVTDTAGRVDQSIRDGFLQTDVLVP